MSQMVIITVVRIVQPLLFWGETARVERPTANLVIVFKRLHNLKACLRFAPRCRKKLFQLATARIRSVVALWS